MKEKNIKSLIPCIITHIAVNSLSVLGVDNTGISTYLIPATLIIISVSYAVFINKTINEEVLNNEQIWTAMEIYKRK